MFNRKSLTGVVVICCFSVCLMAQETDKKNKQDKKNKKSNATKVENRLVRQVMSSFKKAKLTDEQTAKAKEIVGKRMPEIVKIQESISKIYSKEVREKRAAAMKQGKEDGLKGKALANKANEDAGIDVETVEQWNSARKKLREQMTATKSEIMKLLTDEQAAMMKKGNKGKKRKDRKTEGDDKKNGKDKN